MKLAFAVNSRSAFIDSMMRSFFLISFFNFLIFLFAVLRVWLYVNSSSEIRNSILLLLPPEPLRFWPFR